ncbi:nanos homolog 2 [Microcaecilia unicolor]|uniref:Nanos homolog 1 n=1 Tax=Microcaecilia unicolor TaxID=1415580 RepID=A0A6P7ZDJ8_9AMPH|nr:nanos homolog 2 [Microcaecilia unicolor]
MQPVTSSFEAPMCLHSFQEFSIWKDYLQLSKLVQGMITERKHEHTEALHAGCRLPSNTSSAVLGSLLQGERQSSSGHGSSDDQFNHMGSEEMTMAQLPTNNICNFCKHNGESKNIYSSHMLKKPDGTIICPVLRKYICPLCGATGDGAHTLKYCPCNRVKQSLYRKSGRNSAGRKTKR